MKKLLRPRPKVPKTKGKESLLGLPPDDEPERPVVLATKKSKPSSIWNNVTKDDIGSGFKEVDLSEFENPRSRFVFVSKPFRNKFVFGRSRFISWSLKPKLVKIVPPKKDQPFNSNTKVSKEERKVFAKSLAGNINDFQSLFVHEILPVTLAITTAAEEAKEKSAQLVDESIALPIDYMKTKLLQASQMVIIRNICDKMKLNKSERRLMYAEFLPRLHELALPPNRKQK